MEAMNSYRSDMLMSTGQSLRGNSRRKKLLGKEDAGGISF